MLWATLTCLDKLNPKLSWEPALHTVIFIIFSSPEQNAQWELLGHRDVRRPSSVVRRPSSTISLKNISS